MIYQERIFREYYAVGLILIPPVLKGWLPGAAGTIAACFIRMFCAPFIFPWRMKHPERGQAQR